MKKQLQGDEVPGKCRFKTYRIYTAYTLPCFQKSPGAPVNAAKVYTAYTMNPFCLHTIMLRPPLYFNSIASST